MRVTASQRRAIVYKLLDQVIATHDPLIIERRGVKLRIVPDTKGSKLADLPKRKDYLTGAADDLVESNWLDEWNPDSTYTGMLWLGFTQA